MSTRTKSRTISKKKKSPWIAHLERCVKEFKPYFKKKYTMKDASNDKQCRNIFYNMKKNNIPYMFPSDEKRGVLKLNSSKYSSKFGSRAGRKSKRRHRRRTCKKVSCKRRNRS